MSNDELAVMAKTDQAALLELWGQVQKLCFCLAMRYLPLATANKATDGDDLRQCCFLAVQRAVEVYDPTQGAFNTLAGHYVKSECTALLGLAGRIRKEHYNSISMDAPMHDSEEGDALTIADKLRDETLPPMDSDLISKERAAQVSACVKDLPADQQTVIRQAYWQELTARQITAATGMGANAIRATKGRALHTLRRDPRLRDYRPNYFMRVSLTRFKITLTSVTELLALRNIERQGCKNQRYGDVM